MDDKSNFVSAPDLIVTTCLKNSSPDSESSEIVNTSDEEDVTWSEAKRYKMPFGKYKETWLASMIRKSSTRDCLRSLLDWDKLRSDTAANIKCALEHYKANKKKSKISLEK